jgi:sugar phosphate isomerase/epimerase
MAQEKGLRLGTTLFSFTNEYHGREYSLDHLIEKVGSLGLGPGLEIVGFSHVRGFPEISDEFAGHFRNQVAKAGLEQSCLGINADRWIIPDKPMNDDDLLAYHEIQLRAAAKLGFPVARYQFGAGPALALRLLPLAEKLNVKLGMEIHAPDAVDSPIVMQFREMYAKADSPYLGFIPDFGSSADRISPAFGRYFREIGLPEELIAMGESMWPANSANPRAAIEGFAEKAEGAGYKKSQYAEVFMIFGLFSKQKPEAWLEIMPQVVHIHGKFYDFAESGSESAIPYESLLPVFVNAGYNGFMSSEWEGHFFTDDGGFAKVQAHHKLCQRILDAARAASTAK